MIDPRAELTRFFDDAAGRGGTRDHDALWAALRDASQGGKQLRPLLFVSVHEALGGRPGDPAAARVAAALELLHTAFVVHDDVIDGDDVRRGRVNVSGTFAAQARAAGVPPERAGRYGAAAGLLAGDLALAGSVRLVAQCGAPPDQVDRMLDLLDRTLHVTAAGELADVRMSLDGMADVEEALEVTDAKTAAYSFELPLQLAGVLTGTDDRALADLGRFGRLLGAAFQLRDDVHGLFGDPDRTGKSSVSDLREGKWTPLIAYARTTTAWPQIEPHLGSQDIDESTARLVRDQLLACGARRYVEERAIAMAERASQAVAHLPVAPLLQTWVAAVTRDLRPAA